MKKNILTAVLMAAILLTGCKYELIIDAIYQDPERIEPIVQLIDEDKNDEAFDKVLSILDSDKYNSLEMSEIAYKFIIENSNEEGIYILQILFEEHPEVDSFSNNLAWGYNNLGKYKLANYYIDTALKIEPNTAVEYVNKGNALLGLDKYDEALEAFKKGYSEDKKEKHAIWGLGKTYYELKKYNEALLYFELYNEIAPEEENDTTYYICNSLNMLKRYDEAILRYEKLYNKDKSDTSPLYSIAEIYQNELSNGEKALEYCKRILEVDNKDGWAYLNMADYLAQNNKAEEACRYLKKAIDLDSELLYEINYYDSLQQLKGMDSFKNIFK